MGYFVKSLAWKKSAPLWKIQFVSYKNKDIQHSTASKPKKEWDIKRERWRSLGFYNAMSIEEAKTRARQLNSQILQKRQEERLKELETIRVQEQLRFDSVLPVEFVQEFEARFLQIRGNLNDTQLKSKRHRVYTLWRAAQKLIIAMQLEPSEWFFHMHDFYDYFYQEELSLRYMHSILKFANLWGFFICRKTAKPFLPVTVPRGYERQRLIENYYQKQKRQRKASEPLSPDQLGSVADKLMRKNFNWLYLSVWFGLRPKEIDNLKDKNLWSVETLANGRQILWVFQTKIIALPPEDRWKPIPIIFDEQIFALKFLRDQTFKRPLIKTMRKYFGLGTDLYGGRKGFTDLMLSKGHALENISVWLGHSTLERTWRSYKNRKRFHLAQFG